MKGGEAKIREGVLRSPQNFQGHTVRDVKNIGFTVREINLRARTTRMYHTSTENSTGEKYGKNAETLDWSKDINFSRRSIKIYSSCSIFAFHRPLSTYSYFILRFHIFRSFSSAFHFSQTTSVDPPFLPAQSMFFNIWVQYCTKTTGPISSISWRKKL